MKKEGHDRGVQTPVKQVTEHWPASPAIPLSASWPHLCSAVEGGTSDTPRATPKGHTAFSSSGRAFQASATTLTLSSNGAPGRGWSLWYWAVKLQPVSTTESTNVPLDLQCINVPGTRPRRVDRHAAVLRLHVLLDDLQLVRFDVAVPLFNRLAMLFRELLTPIRVAL